MQGNAMAFEAAAALEAYEDQLAATRRLGAHPARIAVLQRELRRVCGCCLRLPQLSVGSVALLLAHHRLLAELARPDREPAAAPVAALRRDVEQCVATLQRACRELFLAPHLH